MQRPGFPFEAALADTPQDVAVRGPTILARGYRTYERYDIAFASPAGEDVQLVQDVVAGDIREKVQLPVRG